MTDPDFDTEAVCCCCGEIELTAMTADPVLLTCHDIDEQGYWCQTCYKDRLADLPADVMDLDYA